MPLPCKLCMYSHRKQICMACSELRHSPFHEDLAWRRHWNARIYSFLIPKFPIDWNSISKTFCPQRNGTGNSNFCMCTRVASKCLNWKILHVLYDIESWRNVFPHQFVILELGSCKITSEKDQEAILKPYSLWYSINRFYVSKAKGLSRPVCLSGLWVVNVCWYCRSLPHTCHMSKFIKKMSSSLWTRQ